MEKEELKATSYKYPVSILERVKATVEKLKPKFRNVNHAFEVAITEWLEKYEPKD